MSLLEDFKKLTESKVIDFEPRYIICSGRDIYNMYMKTNKRMPRKKKKKLVG